MSRPQKPKLRRRCMEMIAEAALLHRDGEMLSKTKWEGADWDNSCDVLPMEVAMARGWIGKQAKQAFRMPMCDRLRRSVLVATSHWFHTCLLEEQIFCEKSCRRNKSGR